MKKILITGENSYIGISFKQWMEQYPEEYQVDTISVRGDNWKEKDFSRYDVVYHVAGVAHIKETPQNRELYYKVNRDLAYEVAKKSKDEDVKQFIFLSSMSVYGLDEGVITRETPLKPKTAYGKSKLEAEEMIRSLQTEEFIISLIRPPMVYGKHCKGNYSTLSKFAKKMPFFLEISNRRSMIYIDNLSEFIKIIIDNRLFGLFFPQNKEYVNTSDLVIQIAKENEKKIVLIKGLDFLMKKIALWSSTLRKVFGTLIYDANLCNFVEYSNIEHLYVEKDFITSIWETEL